MRYVTPESPALYAVYECLDCGALVADSFIHDEWHDEKKEHGK